MAIENTLSSDATRVQALNELCRNGLVSLLMYLGGPADDGAALDTLFTRWDKQREVLGGWGPLAQRLVVANATIDDQLNPALRLLKNALRDGRSTKVLATHQDIAALRVLALFEKLRDSNTELRLNTTLPDVDQESALVRCFKQVRALELVLRGLQQLRLT